MFTGKSVCCTGSCHLDARLDFPVLPKLRKAMLYTSFENSLAYTTQYCNNKAGMLSLDVQGVQRTCCRCVEEDERERGLQRLEDAVFELEVLDTLAIHHHQDLYEDIEC